MRKMRESGHPWLGSIPSNWDVVYPKMLFSQRKDRAQHGDRQLTASQQHGVVYQDEYMEMTGSRVVVVEKDFDILKHVEKGDFVISMRSFQGGIEYSDNTGCISSAYVMLIPKKEHVHNRYFKWLLKSPTYINALQSTSNLVRDGQAMRYANFIQVWLPIVPIAEQIAIAKMLDEKCFQVETLIANVQAQIEKLKAYKQSVITEVVTRGLDPSAPMKDSGVDWIGKIPAKWSLNRIKFCSTYNDESLSEKEDETMVINYVDIGSVSLSEGIFRTEQFTFLEAPSRARRITKSGDIIVSTVRTYLKAIAAINKEDLIVSTGFCVLRPNGVVNNRYMEYFCKSDCFTDNVSANSYGISYPAINASSLVAFHIVVPTEKEQLEIVEFLDDKCSRIDSLIRIKEQKIAKLEQYKKSLIYEYVTGKKEVQ